MTGIASRVGELVVVVRVARLTRCRHVRTRQRELGRAVIEGRRLPSRRRMTRRTVLAEIACNVVGVLCPVEFRTVTLKTGRKYELIISIRVTRLARRRCVHTYQRKLRRVVVECRRLPRCRCMTQLTVRGEPPRHMIRRRGGREL